MELNFDEIRSYNDEEVHEVFSRLSNEKQFMNVLSTVYPLLPKEILKQRLLSYNNVLKFQKEMVYPFLRYLEENKTKGIKLLNLDKINRSEAYVFISNHRDIILDASLFCGKFMENDLDTVEIAIGNNLLIRPWIEDFVRANKSFIVKRGLSAREILQSSELLSRYIAYNIIDRKQSVWIAQREGRAKDSNDRTQGSLLKMLSMSGTDTFLENITRLNICPLTISYEYDPCDYLKAKEFQQKRDDVGYRKQPQDDLINMQVGVMGYKGHIAYALTGKINEQLTAIGNQTNNKNEQIEKIATLIDHHIHANYVIYNNNKIAFDLASGEKRFEKEYDVVERLDFEKYISTQISKIDLEHKDEQFLRGKILEMYANPLINYLKATNKL